ncbi:MAG: hypothetical protein AAGE52_02930 [Myxococcota bacterium]
MSRRIPLSLVLLLAACEGVLGDPGSTRPPPFEGPVTEGVTTPEREVVGEAVYEETRQVRRLTADQFFRSLTTVTGQVWSGYDRYANALGRPDLAEVTDEGRDLSVTFEKLVDDASRETCRNAVVSDRTAEEQVIVRHVTLSDREPAALAENLRYLFLRFLSVEITSNDDPRLQPWMELLTTAPAEGEFNDNAMEFRWQAVCVGLVTHPDFLTY